MRRTVMLVSTIMLGGLNAAVSLALDDGARTERMTITVSSAGYDIVSVESGQRVEMEGFGYLMDPGKPMLPAKRFFVALPPGAKVQSVRVEGIGATELAGAYRIAPTPPFLPLADPQVHTDLFAEISQEWQDNYRAVYASDRAYPEEIGTLTGAGSLRKYAYASVSFHPFQYHPRSGRLVHYAQARVSIDYRPPSPGSAEARCAEELKWDTVADRRASGLFMNFEEMRPLYEPRQARPKGSMSTYDYVIITTGGLAGAVTSSDFVDWKTSLGYSVRIVLITDPEITGQPGADLAEQVREFLRSYYASWGIRYVLLVGDYATVPMRYGFPDPHNHAHNPSNPGNPGGSVPTDYYYADLSLADADSWDLDLDGFRGEYGQDLPDFLAEVAVGRIPTNATWWITYALDKIVSFEGDDGAWKDQVLHAGAMLFHEHQNHDPTLPKIDGARLPDALETDLMGGWTVSHYSEQAGLESSDYPWPALTGPAFSGDWSSGQYGIVNWAGHGAPTGAYRLVWLWDDGDGVFETDGSDGYEWQPFITDSMDLEDDCPSIVFAMSCSIGYPEPNSQGNFGIDLLANPSLGASVGVVSSARTASIMRDWPSEPGSSESICYEFNRFMINGPDGPETVGDALYLAKAYCNQNYARASYLEYKDLYNYNLYGDPSLMRTGAWTRVEADHPGEIRHAALLRQNHPNPFNPATDIRYVVPEDCRVKLEIFNVLGQRVATLVDEDQQAGSRTVRWDATSGGGLPSGVYLCRLEAAGTVAVHKMVLMK